jgi:hypothetical protein
LRNSLVATPFEDVAMDERVIWLMISRSAEHLNALAHGLLSPPPRRMLFRGSSNDLTDIVAVNHHPHLLVNVADVGRNPNVLGHDPESFERWDGGCPVH